MHAERMTQLLRVLEEVRTKPFDMNNWFRHHDCGSYACAIGYATLDPWFNERGLVLLPSLDGRTSYPKFQDCTAFWAVMNFFDISYMDASYLFDSESYKVWNDPMLVHARILEVFPELKQPTKEQDNESKA